MFLKMLFENPFGFLFVGAALVVSITVHEFAHAFASSKLGDPTARILGRVTLNPLAHLDPLGTLFLLIAGFGWGKPVPFNPINLNNPKRDAAIISFAGPLSNFLIALILGLTVKFFPLPLFLQSLIVLTIFYNLVLGFFNLIPLHPLDGFKVVYGILPIDLAWQWQQTERYGIYVLLLLLFTRTTGNILFPLVNFSLGLLGLQ